MTWISASMSMVGDRRIERRLSGRSSAMQRARSPEQARRSRSGVRRWLRLWLVRERWLSEEMGRYSAMSNSSSLGMDENDIMRDYGVVVLLVLVGLW